MLLFMLHTMLESLNLQDSYVYCINTLIQLTNKKRNIEGDGEDIFNNDSKDSFQDFIKLNFHY